MDNDTTIHRSAKHRRFGRPVSRRAMLHASLLTSSLWVLRRTSPRRAAASVDSRFTGWKPWLLSAPDQLRPQQDLRFDPGELSELRDLQARRTAQIDATVRFWDDPTIILPWTDLALDLIKSHRLNAVRAGRALALLHTALFDTLLATADARRHSDRPHPTLADPGIVPLGKVTPRRGSFPSEHAAVAEAAAAVLTYLFPGNATSNLAAMADEATISRLWAGQAVRSDVAAGQAIGQAVGQLAVAHGQNDHSSLSWDGARPAPANGIWEPTPPNYDNPPLEPTAGRWRPWVLPDGAAFRPVPPPSYRSPAWRAEIEAVRFAVTHRTNAQAEAAHFWHGTPDTVTPASRWIEIARDLLRDTNLNALSAARVMALTSVALFDAAICCWDAKYAYWVARPITIDPSLNVLLPTPPFPAYTSSHATLSTAAATVLGHLFPSREADISARAVEARNASLWAGTHFGIDIEMGAVSGASVGRLVMARDTIP